jgi:asparagine synthase (glutamine-hydrolysing)
MCGIAGIIGRDDPEAASAVQRMVSQLRHRGPDDAGVQPLTGAVLGHARLSIIDLSGGHQPMASADERYWITFNGEIYNYRELREELQSRGHSFRTHSDTEVLLEMYRAFGPAGLNRLNGMYSFAVWDAREQKLFAARDRMGKKPFFFVEGPGGGLFFASEIKALLASGLVEPEFDAQSLDLFMALGYVPPHRTAFRRIVPLPPAHYLEWSSGKLGLHRYWDVRLSEQPIQEDEAAAELFGRVQTAVKRRLVADVTVGAFLSGGLDSSTVVALMQRAVDRPVQTFCVAIREHLDERSFARAVAEQEKTDHHEIDVHIPVAETLERMAGIYDEPFGDSSCVPTFIVSEFARRSVKVVLTGDGGDELFAGYENRYTSPLLREDAWSGPLAFLALRLAARAVAAAARRGLSLNGLPDRLERERQRAELARRHPDPLDRHLLQMTRLSPGLRRTLWTEGRVAEPVPIFPDARPPYDQPLLRAFWFDLKTWLPGDILVKVDRASMAVGLEARCPLLDPDVVEFALSLPLRLKLSGHSGKYLFRKAFASLWPEPVRHRKKLGFGTPEQKWLARDDVKQLVRDGLCAADAPLGPWMRRAELQRRVDNYYRGIHQSLDGGLSSNQMWTLLCLALWMKRWSRL